MLAPATAFALELGEATVRSGIGQALFVQIPYRLTANERLAPACVGLTAPARLEGAFPAYTRASRIAITSTHIEIFGDSRVLEPLIGLTVDVQCNTAPRFVRSYELFVDLPARVPALVDSRRVAPTESVSRGATSAAASTSSASTGTRAPRASVAARARGETGGTLAQGQTYVVVRGDTLSGIAARVADRPATIRDTAEAIFAANPGAFARGNRDLLEAGRSITIPVMTPAATAPAQAPAAAAVVSGNEAELPTATPLPVADEPAAATSETLPPSASATTGAVVPELLEPPAFAAVQPSAAAVPAPAGVSAESASQTTAARASTWLTALLALGVVIVLSAPLLFVRRRKEEAPLQEGAKPSASQPRRLVDPVAGFDVVEERLTRAPSDSNVLGANDSVDLDVGLPINPNERIDSLEDRADSAAPVDPVGADATIEKMASDSDVPEQTIDDEQHTLTIVELDILRQDYEAEHTLTQAASQALRDALADLRATQTAHAAGADEATLEMPRESQTEPVETQRTQRLRSSR